MTTTTAVVLTVLAVTVAIVIAALAAAVAGFLARGDGASPYTALTRAGVAFGATLTLIAIVVGTLNDLIV